MTNLATTSKYTISRVIPPNLPLAPPDYASAYIETLNNVLRLYFNRLSNGFNSIIGPNGGQYIDCPNSLFFNTASQTFAAPNTGYPIEFNQTYLHNAIDLVSNSRVTILISGVYNFQYSGQLKSSSAANKSVWIWIRRNGIDIGYSTRAYTVSLNNEYKSIDWNFNIDMTAGDYLELIIAVDNVNIQLDAETPTAPHTGIPSSVMTINFVAPLPDPLPVPP
jgi:hypothetical protein